MLDLDRVRDLRGWTAEAMTRLGIVSVDGDRVVIPVHDQSGERVGRLRYQPDPQRRNGNDKMLADAGTARELFPQPERIGDDDLLDRLSNEAQASFGQRVIWLVEGEPDVVRMWSIGLVAVGVPGAQNWRDEWAARFRRPGWSVVVCFDCDDAGRTNAPRAATALTENGVAVRVLDLAPERDDGYDLSDFTAAALTADERAKAAQLLRTIAADLPLYVPTVESAPPTDDRGIEFVTGLHFVAHPVPQAEPIVVDATGATAIPAIGFGMTYGDGGAGKTTLWLDASMHFCAGVPWLDGLLTPTRALTVGWVENEGPQEEFRRKLERKLDGWRERFAPERFHVLAHPWARLDLRDEDHRAGLGAAIRDHDLDLLVIGPLNDLGMEGGGTPDQVRAFHDCIRDVQRRAERLVSLMVLHHENTAGRISGAWTGRPDLLVHVVAQGHGKTRVHWQKAKWSSPLHGTSLTLRWEDGESFAADEETASRPERVWDDIAAYVLAHGGCSWNEIDAAVSGQDDYKRRRRDQMLADGVLVNAGTGKAFKLWHRDDPARPQTIEVRPGTDAPADAPASDTGDGAAEPGASVRPLVRGTHLGRTHLVDASPGEIDADHASAEGRPT